MSNTPVYNKVGKGYNDTRSADPYLAGRLHELLNPEPDGHYLDIGCGTGNYTAALAAKQLNITGVEPSETMLEQARESYPELKLIQATAEALPFDDNSFNGAIATFTIHHWADKQKGLAEICRVLKPGSNMVLLSYTPEQQLSYWLCKYFPKTLLRSAKVVLPLNEMHSHFKTAGFDMVETEKYFIKEDLTDHFLYSNKYRPAQYLDPQVRNGISSFTVYADEPEVAAGLVELEEDIASGVINEVIKQYENDLGDYLFYIARKA